MTNHTCSACDAARAPWALLCLKCWHALPMDLRRELRMASAEAKGQRTERVLDAVRACLDAAGAAIARTA